MRSSCCALLESSAAAGMAPTSSDSSVSLGDRPVRSDDSSRAQLVENFFGSNLRAHTHRRQSDFGRFRRLIGGIQTGKMLDASGFGLCIKTLWITANTLVK